MNDKDLICLSRIIQSALFENDIGIFYGCQFCVYSSECSSTFIQKRKIHFDTLREKLQDITEVDLRYQYDRNHPEAKFRDTTIHTARMPAEGESSPSHPSDIHC